jgi:di- and tripeptidase
MGEGAGDLFSLTWSSELQTIFVGCQNTSLQWFDFREPISGSPSSSSVVDSSTLTSNYTPMVGASRKVHKFFDSYPQYERKPADIHANNMGSRSHGQSTPDSDHSDAPPREYISIPPLMSLTLRIMATSIAWLYFQKVTMGSSWRRAAVTRRSRC